jgi:hypothetical protein
MRRARDVLTCLLGVIACRGPAPASPAAPVTPPSATIPQMRSFQDDVTFLSSHGAALKLLSRADGARIAVSGAYQARVMTSSVSADGASLGFVNRAFIQAGKVGTAFDNYGGADRFWLGPEGSQYTLYFAPGKPFEFQKWQTPHAFQEGAWTETASTDTSVTYTHSFTLENYAKTPLSMEVSRKLALLGSAEAKANLGVAVASSVSWVGYSSENTVRNSGTQAWTEAQGLPCIWILGMFNPAPGTRIVLPFETQGSGDVVNDRYFGKVPADRLLIDQARGVVLFKADGEARGKIGLSPSRAKPVLGSYSAPGRLLTIVRFSKPAGADRYVNNLWELSKTPYAGDVSNAYNDGPVEPGKPSLGGFYELESSSPASALAPGASLTHTHETYHFTGPQEALEPIALKVLGVSLADVERAPL